MHIDQGALFLVLFVLVTVVLSVWALVTLGMVRRVRYLCDSVRVIALLGSNAIIFHQRETSLRPIILISARDVLVRLRVYDQE